MLRKNFHKDLENLHLLLLEMGETVEEVIKLSVEGLKDRDLEKSKQAINLDEKVDALELCIEKECIDLFALQTPVAMDLRKVTTILKMITDLERIGDYGVNIANDTIKLNNKELIKPLVDIPKMAELTIRMVRQSLDSFVKEDAEMARNTAKMDESIDYLYEKIYSELLEKINTNKDDLDQIVYLLFIGRHLERMADHATNICEKIIFMTTNKRVVL